MVCGRRIHFDDQCRLLALIRLRLGLAKSGHPHLRGYYWILNIGLSVLHEGTFAPLLRNGVVICCNY